MTSYRVLKILYTRLYKVYILIARQKCERTTPPHKILHIPQIEKHNNYNRKFMGLIILGIKEIYL